MTGGSVALEPQTPEDGSVGSFVHNGEAAIVGQLARYAGCSALPFL